MKGILLRLKRTDPSDWGLPQRQVGAQPGLHGEDCKHLLSCVNQNTLHCLSWWQPLPSVHGSLRDDCFAGADTRSAWWACCLLPRTMRSSRLFNDLTQSSAVLDLRTILVGWVYSQPSCCSRGLLLVVAENSRAGATRRCSGNKVRNQAVITRLWLQSGTTVTIRVLPTWTSTL